MTFTPGINRNIQLYNSVVLVVIFVSQKFKFPLNVFFCIFDPHLFLCVPLFGCQEDQKRKQTPRFWHLSFLLFFLCLSPSSFVYLTLFLAIGRYKRILSVPIYVRISFAALILTVTKYFISILNWQRVFYMWGAAIAQWIRLRLSSSRPGFQSQAHHIHFNHLQMAN